jgi:hypothetical protein
MRRRPPNSKRHSRELRVQWKNKYPGGRQGVLPLLKCHILFHNCLSYIARILTYLSFALGGLVCMTDIYTVPANFVLWQ